MLASSLIIYFYFLNCVMIVGNMMPFSFSINVELLMNNVCQGIINPAFGVVLVESLVQIIRVTFDMCTWTPSCAKCFMD